MTSKILFILLLFVVIGRQGIAQTLQYQDSPFGFHPALPYNEAKSMGIQWTRGGDSPYLFWSLVDPNKTGDPAQFQWKGTTLGPTGQQAPFDYDALFIARDAGLNMLQNIDVQPNQSQGGHRQSGSWLPVDEAAYRSFVKEAVKRYSFIRYWQVGNEPNLRPNNNLTGFADLQRITYEAIKEANPQAQVLIGGVAGNMSLSDMNDTYFESILPTLSGKHMDVFDIHFYGDAKGGTLISDPQRRMLGYRDFKTVYTYFRNLLDKNNFSHVLIWVTEMGTFSGTIKMGPQTLTQTEAEHARDLFKRWVYALSLGVKKIFWVFGIMEGFGAWDDDFFDHTALIYSGLDGVHRRGEKKLGYYTHKLMTEKMEGSDWTTIETIREDTANKVYIYKFTKGGKPIYVAWWDYFNDATYMIGKTKQVSITNLQSNTIVVTEAVPGFSSGTQVTDYKTAFRTDTLAVTGGTVTLTVGENPVFVESSVITSVEDKRENIPEEFVLYQNYPNPFNPETSISYTIPNVETRRGESLQHVTLKVYDLIGKEIATLVDGNKQPGNYTIKFNAEHLPSGIYFYRLQAGDFSETKKMILTK